jgi:hypothetical protein
MPPPSRSSAEAVNRDFAASAVSLARATTVVVGPSGAVITALGDTLQLTATLFDATGAAVADAAFTWSSSHTEVATVDSAGLVTAVGEGRVTIEAVGSSGEDVDTASSRIVVVDAARAAGTDRAALIALYVATDGPNWKNDNNWLTDAQLDLWHGVETGAEGRVMRLALSSNGLTGPIPPALAELAELEVLSLHANGLTGPIPTEFSELAHLRSLSLYLNHFTGPIPPSLGELHDLENLNLGDNYLTGPIPAALTGLSRLRELLLPGNGLTGLVPPELGELSALSSLQLQQNNLTGPVPPEIGQLSGLRYLYLADNRELSGPLPEDVTRLDQVEKFTASRTGLCLPSDSVFQAWINTIPEREIADCPDDEPSVQHPAYLTQAVQSRGRPVPLVAGEKALLRIFHTAARSETVTIPGIRAHFYVDSVIVYTAEVPAHSVLVETEIREDDLSRSSNAEIPGEIIRPGLEMVIEVDTAGLDPGLGIVARIPATGRVEVEVRQMPVLDLTVVPFLWDANPHWGAVEAAQAMEADPDGYELLRQTRTLLPVGDIRVTAHPPVLTSLSPDDFYDLFDLTKAIQVLEGGNGRYMGTMSRPGRTGKAGAAERPGRVLISRLNPFTMAHEIGHTMSLYHAPACRAGGADPEFPDRYGSIGAWGYDFVSGSLVPPNIPDVMSYCDPSWVSDYHFGNALRFRLSDEDAVPPAGAPSSPSLFLWGGMDSDGELFLNPAFAVDAKPALPEAAGMHRITGRTANGGELFSVSFGLPEVADGDGRSSFAFVLPVELGWTRNLASITLSGPGGEARLDGDTDIPTSILLDPSTGQVRGILRDAPQAYGAVAPAPPPPGADRGATLFSRGIPDI